MSEGHSFRANTVMRFIARHVQRPRKQLKREDKYMKRWRGRVEFKEAELRALSELAGKALLSQIRHNAVDPNLTSAVTKITKCLGSMAENPERPGNGHPGASVTEER